MKRLEPATSILLTVLLGFHCGLGTAQTAVAAETRAAGPVSMADATTIAIGEIRQLVPTGHHPSFSPDGNSILFDKGEPLLSQGQPTGFSTSSIWVMSKDGTNVRRLVSDGRNAAWSPDGKRIAFQPLGSLVQVLGGETNLAIFDLASQRTFPLGKLQWGSFEDPEIRWARDGSRILFGGHAIDLDSLQVQPLFEMQDYPDRKATDQEGAYLGLVDAWEREHAFKVYHPKMRFLTRAGIFHLPVAPTGLWVSNRDDSFERLLSDYNWARVSLSPDLSTVVLESSYREGGISIARLGTAEPTVRRFTAGIGRTQVSPEFAKGLSFPHHTPCLERPIMASVNGPRVNPLNGKTIGPDGELKGDVKFTQLLPDRSEIAVWVEKTPIRPGDVITGIRTFNDLQGEGRCYATGVWGVIGALSSEEAVRDRGAAPVASRTEQHAAAGDTETWEGTAEQSGYPAYAMILKLTGDTGASEYPSLGCGGLLASVDTKGGRQSFRERITKGRDRCLDGVVLSVERRPDGTLAGTFVLPDGKLGGVFKLLRK